MGAEGMMGHIVFIQKTTYMLEDGRQLIIRPAMPSDQASIISNVNAICAEQVYLQSNEFVLTPSWQAMLEGKTNEEFPWLLAVGEIDGRVVGHGRVCCSGFGHKDRHVADVGIALLKPYRGLNIGTKLLEYLVNWATTAGYEKLTASVLSTNLQALNLFDCLGFVKEGLRRQQFKIEGQPVDEILLSKFLYGEPSFE